MYNLLKVRMALAVTKGALRALHMLTTSHTAADGGSNWDLSCMTDTVKAVIVASLARFTAGQAVLACKEN